MKSKISTVVGTSFLLALAGAQTPDKSQQAPHLSPQEVYERFHDSVVKIETDKKSGTGFFIRDGQTVVTADHVLGGATSLIVHGTRGENWYVDSCQTDSQADVAILHLTKPTGRKPIHLADFSGLKPGSEVTVIANPLGFLTDSVSSGILSARRIDQDTELVQFTAAVSPGCSGGPVIDSAGEVVGLVSFNFTQGQALNLAVADPPIHRLLEKPSELISAVFQDGKKADEDAKREADDLAQKAAAASAAADAAKKEHDDRLAKAKQDLETLRNQESEFTHEIESKNARTEEQTNNIASCTTSLNSTISDANTAAENYNDAVAQYNSLQRQIEQLNQQPGSIGSGLESLGLGLKSGSWLKKANNYRRQYEDLRAQATNLQNQITLAQADLDNTRAEIATLRSKLDAVKIAEVVPEAIVEAG